MYLAESSEHPRLALYRKAREIMQISRRISDYLTPDLAMLNDSGREDKNIYFTGDIIRYSSSLIPNIMKAENEFFQDARMGYISSISHLTDRLTKHCEKLEGSNSNGREFIKILRREIQKFRKLHRIWKLTL